MEKKYQIEFLEWSNLFLLMPFIMALIYGLYWYGIILLAVLIISFDFHFFKQARQVFYLDVLFSSILMLSNLVLLFMGHWLMPFSLVAVSLALIALFFYFRKSKHDYYLNHSLWHVFSAGVCIFCLMTFLMFA